MLYSALLKKPIRILCLLPNLCSLNCSLNAKIVASLVALCLVLALNANHAAAQATFVWTGNINNSWTNSGNWQLVSGTDLGASGYPDAGDDAVFQNSPATPTTIINADQTLGNLTLSGSAQVTLDLNGGDLIINNSFSVTGTGSIQITNGNFQPNSVTISNGTAIIQTPLTVNATTDVNGGTLTLGAEETTFEGPFTLSSGTFNAGSGAINVQNATFTKSGGTFNGQTATFRFNTNASYTVSSNTDITFHKIEYNSSVSGGSITFSGTGGVRTFTIANSLTRSVASGTATNGINLTNAVLAYSPGASLIYNYNTTNRNVDPDEWPTTNGPTNVTHSGSQVTLPTGTPRTIPNGGKLLLNSSTSNFVANSVITIQGTLERSNPNFGITSTAPQYSGSSTDDSQLTYNLSGGTLTIGLEWPASNSPRNVRLEGTGSPIVQTANGSGTVTRTVANNLQILIGTLRGEDATTDLLNVDVGGTLETGTLTTQGSFDNGTITLIGTGNQTIVGGSGTTTVSNLTINKQTVSDEVTVSSGILKIKSGGVLRIQQGILQLAGTSTNVLDITGAQLRIDNGGTFRTGGKTITTGAGTTYQLNNGSIFEYNGTGGAETALSIDANDSPSLGPANSYAILRVSNTINIPTGDVDVREELQFNTSVNAAVNTGGTNGLLRLGLGATITGDNSTTTRFVNGPLRRFFDGSNLTGKFSVGKVSPAVGANDITFAFQSLSSALAFTIEQFNQAPTGTVTGGGLPTNARYWRILSPSRALSGENYRLTIDIAGSNIPTPLNRIVRLTTGSFGSNPTFAAPEGTPQNDDGTSVTNAAGVFPYTSLADGSTPGFTLAQIGGKLWDGGASTTSWFDANNWDPDGVPIATDNVIIGTPAVPNPTVVVGTGTAVSNTINVGGLAGAPTLRIDNVNAIDLDDVTPGAQWVAAKTTFGAASTVEYLQGNVRSDQYANLTVDGTGTIGTAGGAIVVVGNFVKSNTSTFSPTHDIGVTGNFTISGGTFNAGAQTYTIGGNFTRSATFNAGTSTVEFNSDATQQLSGTTTFYNLTCSNGGTLSLQPSTDVTISNQLNLDDGVLTINANTLTLNGTITGNGFLSGSNTSNLVIGGANGDIGTIRFQAGNRLLNNLTINRTGTNPAATLGTDLSVAGTLTMTSGILNTTATNVLTTVSTSGGSPTAYVNGPLQIGQVGTANASYPKNYPVGDGSVYRPFQITTGPDANTVQRVQLVNSSPLSAGATPGGGLSAISAFRYWELTDNTGTAAGTQAGDQVVLGYVLNPVDDGINNLSPYPLRAAARSAPLAGPFSPFAGTDIASFLGVRGVQSNNSLTTGLRFYTLGSVNATDAPLPVELVSFTGVSSRAGVVLSWETASERESAGFIINRRIVGIGSGEWQVIDDYTRNPNLRAKNSLNGAKYAYTDASDLPAGTVLEYRLDEVSFSGAIERLREVRVETRFSTVVTDFALEQNYPNPFNPTTSIPYQLKERAKVTLDIYNTLGQKVATVVDAVQERGNYAANFNAASLASGMYFYRLTAQGASQTFVQTRKMMLLK